MSPLGQKIGSACALSLATLVATASPLFAQASPATLDDLSFLAGCWEGDLGDGSTIRETYTAPRGGAMLGNSQVVAGGETQFFEFIQMVQDKDGISYRPSPGAQKSVAFKLAKLADGEVAFENPDHDFPQRISYKSGADGTLTARIELMNGEKAQSFAMKAAACGSSEHQRLVR